MSFASPQVPPPAAAELEKFIFHPDKFSSERVPRNLHPAEVVQFLVTRIQPDTPFKAFQQTEKVAKFYDAREAADHFRSLVEKMRAGGELRRTIVVARILAWIGAPADLQYAAAQYKTMAAQASNREELEQLVHLLAALGPGTDPRPLPDEIAKQLAGTASSKGDNYQARLESGKLEELQRALARAQGANKVKANILTMADRRARIDEEIKAYLSLGYGYLEYLQPWAAIRLRREVWGPDPANQVTRADDPARRAELAAEFRRIMGALETVPKLPRETIPSLRVRCLRAIEFFGVPLSAPEKTYVREHAGMQDDVLSNE